MPLLIMDTLPRLLGPFSAFTLVVGSIIGSGIFVKPQQVATHLDSFGLIIGVWIVVGLVTLCGSLALAELAAMLPAAGGPYVYLREAYGRLPAFLWGWTEFWVIRTGSLGALSAATAIYMSQLVPLTMGGQEMVAIAIVVALSAINMVGTRWGAAVQNLTTVLKIAFLGLIIVLPFAMRQADPANLLPILPAEPSPNLWRGLAMAMIAVLWAYDGWINVAPVAEEIRDPQRNVPLALALGVTTIIVLYVLATTAYHLVLTLDEVRGSEAVAATMCSRLLGGWGGKLVALGVMCSTFGAVNSNMLTGPRIYFAMARDGLLPAGIRQVHPRWQTPFNAILLQALWTVALIVAAYAWAANKTEATPVDAFDTLTDFVIFGGSVFYALAVAAVFVLRRTRPELPRPYRTWGYPLVPSLYMVAFGAAMLSLLLNKPIESLAGATLILAGVVFYAFVRRAR
ncbi:MAG: amino acid permease [Pirellulales bacterium]